MAQMVKNLSAMQGTWVQSLGWEDPLERERLPTPVFSPGEFHRLYSLWGRKESDTTERLSLSNGSLQVSNWRVLFELPFDLVSSPCFLPFVAHISYREKERPVVLSFGK